MISLLFVQGTGIEDRFIRWGQHFRCPKYDKFTHVAVLIDDQLLESTGKHGVRIGDKDGYKNFVTEKIDYPCTPEEQALAARFALSCVGRKYDWLEIISIGIALLTGCAINVTTSRTMICSEYAGRILEHAGAILDRDPNNDSPAQLRAFFGE